MTKEELRKKLVAGETLTDLFNFSPGQLCEIFKADEYRPGDEIIYIPDMQVIGIDITKPILDEDDLEQCLNRICTGDDLMDAADSVEEVASLLFDWCDWQYPNIQDIEEAYPEVFEKQK